MKVNYLFLVRWTIGTICFTWLAGMAAISGVLAQDEEDLPDPVTISLETKDGVALSALYYPGTRDKETVPVILLHAWKDNHTTMVNIASTLQRKYGYAAIVPDMRGHGDSDKTTTGEELDRTRWRANDLAAMIEDIEACKNFLIKENNKGTVNIDMLAVVADKEATILAANWTLRDWSYAPLGSLKQGQDVKALILLNPVRNFKGLNGNAAYQNAIFTGRSGAVFPIIVASERDGRREARNIFEKMKRSRKSLDIKDEAIEFHSYEIERQRRVHKSRRNGDKPMDVIIGDFIQKQVFDRRHDFRWAERGSK